MANTFITGMTGTGKSYLAREIIKSNKLKKVVISLKKQDIINFDKEVTAISKNAITNENYENINLIKDKIGQISIGFYMDFISVENQIKFIDELSLILRHKKNLVIYIDECHNFLSQSGKYSQNLESLISMARENNIHLILATQRPQDMRKSPLNNCKWKISFLLGETNAITSMSRIFEGVTDEQIKNLREHEFIIQNSYTKETLYNQKV